MIVNKLKYIVLLVALYCPALSQGLDWQYSARLPFNVPRFFVGLTGEADYNYSFSKLPLTEKDYRPCCDFTSGTGYAGAVGLNLEYWFVEYSIFSKVMYSYYAANFSKEGYHYPVRYGEEEYFSEYNYNTSITQLIIEPGVRYRLFGSQFSLAGSVKANIVVSSDSSDTDSDSNFPHYETKIPGLNTLYLTVNIGASYDFSMGLGKYSTIGFHLGIPVTGLTSKGSWYPMNLGVSFAYNTSLF